MYAGGMSYFSSGSVVFSSHVSVCAEALANAASEARQVNKPAVATRKLADLYEEIIDWIFIFMECG
jgi:hypothetical protein